MGKASEEDPLLVAVEKVKAETLKLRNEGIEDLRRILFQIKGSPRLDPLRDEAYHKIFEAIFELVRAEKANYLQASKSTTKNTVASRLSVAASTLRLVTEIGCSKIKHKTATAVLDHITSVLPSKDEGFCEPLRADYLKIFKALLEFTPHGEHFRPKQWQAFVDFILDGINFEFTDRESNGTRTPARDLSMDSRNGRHISVRVSQGSSSRPSRGEIVSSVEDLLSCIRLLTTISNAPLISRASDIIRTLVDFLNTSSKTPEAAFETINNILLVALTENVALARKILHAVIPVIKKLWSPTKPGLLRDQMLTTLALSEGLFLEAAAKDFQIEPSQMSDFLDILMQEYSRRSEREVLQLAEIEALQPGPPHFLSATTIAPLLKSSVAVSNWVTLSVMASLIVGLEKHHFRVRRDVLFDEQDGARKRQKVAGPIDELVYQANYSSGQERLCAIQVLLHVLNHLTSRDNRTVEDMKPLIEAMLDDDSTLVSWIMILLSELAYKCLALNAKLTTMWQQIWKSAARNLSGTATCRAGCHLLNSILRSGVMDGVIDQNFLDSALFGTGLNGPCALSDTALHLWTTVISSDVIGDSKTFQTMSNKSIRWLDAHWTFHRPHNTQMAFHAQSETICRLLMASVNTTTELRAARHEIITSSIYRTLLRFSSSLSFNRFLLNLEVDQKDEHGLPRTLAASRGFELVDLSRQQQIIMEMLLSKIKAFRDGWDALFSERSPKVSDDILWISTTLCVTCVTMVSIVQEFQKQKVETLLSLIRQFFEAICKFVDNQEDDVRHTSLSLIAGVVLRLEDPATSSSIPLARSRAQLTFPLLGLLRQELDSRKLGQIPQHDLMDFEDSFHSQGSRTRQKISTSEISRQYLPIISDTGSATVHFTVLLVIDEVLSRQSDHIDTDAVSEIVSFVQTLDPGTLLAARIALTSFFKPSLRISRSDTHRLLDKVGEACVKLEDHDRCEAYLCFCLDLLISFAWTWTLEHDDLALAGSDLYKWYLKVARGKIATSPKVMLSTATLIGAVMSADPQFGADVSLPSPRTILFDILKVGDNNLRYHLADMISKIFDRFILTEHEAIFNDVVDNLPSDPEDPEGIAVRLFILGELASKWHAVLRPAVYNLFETPAHIPSSTKLAMFSLRRVCRKLELTSSRALLHLFASQILYTWLEKESIDSIPFKIFEYESLQDLLRDLQNEVIGQTAMRATDSLVKSVSTILGFSWHQLLTASFAKAEAYAIARDINVPPEVKGAKSLEASIRRELGNDVYLQLIRKHFPEIVASLFITLGDLQTVERALARQPELEASRSALERICGRSRSAMVLPAAQQPSFRAKYLPEELIFLYQRVEHAHTDIWTSAMLTYVYRKLLDQAVPALGPLHACSVLRKIRVLVSFAGESSLEGYSLEMLLHNLRPYLINFHCSEDALGIFWYLVEYGREYLQSHLSFLAGLSVTTFTALSRFRKSSQDSTTQESHFRSTMSKVQEFHDWFGNYLSALDLSSEDQNLMRSFKKIIHLSTSVSKVGSSIKGSVEGDLLLTMLEDQSNDKPLLTESAFRLAVEILCHEFEPASELADDILIEISKSGQFAPMLTALIHQVSLPNSFHTWVAHALGRSYASKGVIDWSCGKKSSPPSTMSSNTSKTMILRHLEEFIRQDDPHAASLAEKTLQIVSSALSYEDRVQLGELQADANLLGDLAFFGFPCPQLDDKPEQNSLDSSFKQLSTALPLGVWASVIAREVCLKCSTDPVLAALPVALAGLPLFAIQVLPAIVHIGLSSEDTKQGSLCQVLSSVFQKTLADCHIGIAGHLRVVVNTLLHLRRMPHPREMTMADRNNWLDVDLGQVAASALTCSMPSAALLFLELKISQSSLKSSRTSRRSSISPLNDLREVMPTIFQSVDDIDFFYSVQETPTMASLIKKLNHEGSDFKTLSFESALYNSSLKFSRQETSVDFEVALFSALSNANFDGLAKAVQGRVGILHGEALPRDILQVPLNLHQWDLPRQLEQFTAARIVTDVFQVADTASNTRTVINALDQALSKIMKMSPLVKLESRHGQDSLLGMALLSEMRELFNGTSSDHLNEVFRDFEQREWSANDSFGRLAPILLGREALFSTLKINDRLRSAVNISSLDSQLFEVKSIKDSLRVGRDYEAAQFCLNRAVHLSKLSEIALKQDVKFDAIAQQQLAIVLWDQGEHTASIQILSSLNGREDLALQSIPISRAEILADLGHEIAEARLDKPDEIIRTYLLPAIEELNGRRNGTEAGRVFHNFAAFCDLQLQNVDGLDDYKRIEGIRQRKEREVQDLERMVSKTLDVKQRDILKRLHLEKAKTWLKLDDEEYRRLKANREKFAQQCLENYLLSLQACDKYSNDVLRFVALWMDQSDTDSANAAVNKHLSSVPSRKFAPLMNQLSSRILDQKNDFQRLLFDLLLRICADHPYHSLYQIFALSKSKSAKTDEVASSRVAAATQLAKSLMKPHHVANIWVAIHNSNVAFVHLANERLPEKKAKAGVKWALHDLKPGVRLEQTIQDSKTAIAPPTLRIDLRADRDYSSIPTYNKFDPHFSIAGGVSAPKIVTIIASDGNRYKMLLKGGNDDLRQDSIMEQVFEQVSNLLKDHRPTRQRKLGIRTYKVIPLTHNAGIIEFVKDTIPLNDYLLPAHQRYYPKDYKPQRCRKEVQDAQTKPLSQRLQAYRNVCANFHPVMRFFFMEHFLDPDIWFQKRLNYSRSTAAISILGHVLGIGDRHGHNILLDEQTGEVVHIDLGVAFETGRVLPVPEVVPFRLTRDLVDGMGLSGVEGVFRRCCNFTLEALRLDQYAIMTILDVLRYDPLYSWSVSPLRLQRMQEEQENAAAAAAVDQSSNTVGKSMTVSRTRAGTSPGPVGSGAEDTNEQSEADRVLAVVSKKLGKTLSAEATVNELIQQATDEKNLAALYCGWAAYA